MMQYLLKCCKCGKAYDWYDTVSEHETKPEGDMRNISIRANGLKLVHFEPLPERNKEKFEVTEAEGGLEGIVINLCPECMRDFLSNICPRDDAADCFSQV